MVKVDLFLLRSALKDCGATFRMLRRVSPPFDWFGLVFYGRPPGVTVYRVLPSFFFSFFSF